MVYLQKKREYIFLNIVVSDNRIWIMKKSKAFHRNYENDEHPQLNSEIKKIEILSDIKYKLHFPPNKNQ